MSKAKAAGPANHPRNPPVRSAAHQLLFRLAFQGIRDRFADQFSKQINPFTRNVHFEVDNNLSEISNAAAGTPGRT